MSGEAEMLYERAVDALEQEEDPQVLRNLMRKIEAFKGSSRFDEASVETQKALGDVLGRLRDRVESLEAGKISEGHKPVEGGHKPQAEALMNKAESAFWAGKFLEAIGLYEKVLAIEPQWERAKEHKRQAEQYLRENKIPDHALPTEAAIAFGKATSALRAQNLKRAEDHWKEAKKALKDAGLRVAQWAEGRSFETALVQAKDAREAYDRGLQLLREGHWEEAIHQIQAAADLSGYNLYRERVERLRQDWKTIEEIRSAFFSRPLNSERVLNAVSKLRDLQARYPDNATLNDLERKAREVLVQIGENLAHRARNLLRASKEAATLASARKAIDEARRLLRTLQTIPLDESLLLLEREIEEQGQSIGRVEEKIRKAKSAKSPWRRWKVLGEVQRQYPDDAEIERLRKDVAWVGYLRTAGLVMLGLFAIIILGAGFKWGWQEYRSYTLSLTPSPTPTATMTPTATPTMTLTPTPTPTFTPTPTPVTMTMKHGAWAHSGCYAAYPVIGHMIPKGATVYLLPKERRFDERGLECVLIEYRAGDASLIGWVLLADLEP